MAKNKYSNLKGIKLYNTLLGELSRANEKAPNRQKLSQREKRKIVSEQLYPKYKNAPQILAKSVTRDINGIIRKLAPAEICNPLYLSEAYLAFVEYWEIDNHIRTVLPECLEVRVNAGDFGVTKIFNTSNYSYYSNGVQKIIEAIREEMGNTSGRAYFNGIVKVKPRRSDDGNPANYFVDYVLYVNDSPEADDEGRKFKLPKKADKKVEKVRDVLVEKFKVLEKEKRKRKRQAKKKFEETPEGRKQKQQKIIRELLIQLRLLYEYGAITWQEYERQRKKYLNKKP